MMQPGYAIVEQEGWTASGSEVCFEIKPKAGFLPSSAAIRPEHGIKLHIPRLQLLQQLRLAKVTMLWQDI